MLFTTSWDDGHPLDLKLADLLARHGFAGTFYVPLHNREGLPVLGDAELRRLAQGHEIGSHTQDHCYANQVSPADWVSQVRQGKAGLEQRLGQPVPGFCYPGGKFNRRARQVVVDAGFAYARTTVNLQLQPGSDRFALPTTLQFYPHAASVLLRNWLRQGQWRVRGANLHKLASAPRLHGRLLALLHQALAQGGMFHLWGHSWELDRHGLWAELDTFLAEAAQLVPAAQRGVNAQLAPPLMPAAAVPGGPA